MRRTNTTPTTESTARTAAIMPSVRTYYCGETKGGRVKLMRDGVAMYGQGNLYEVISSRTVEGKRKIKLNATPTRCTLDYVPQPGSKEKRITCIGRRSGKEFRFVGTIELTEPRPEAIQSETWAVPTGRGSEGALRTQPPQLVEELKFIAAARNTGFDPSLKLNQVCVLLQESRSSVYRKIALGVFPPPIKRGKGSFWLLSHIETYATGNWLATAGSQQ